MAAATAVFLHEGYHVPMATIAAEAGVGVGTLYRRYPSRVALLEALTHRSFRLLVALAEEAEARAGEALARLDWYWDRVIDQRDQLVLPLHGGPPVAADHVRAERARLHACLRRLLDAGCRDGSLRDDVGTDDIILFGGAPRFLLPGASNWDAVATSPEGDPPRRPWRAGSTGEQGPAAFIQIMRGAPGHLPRLR